MYSWRIYGAPTGVSLLAFQAKILGVGMLRTHRAKDMVATEESIRDTVRLRGMRASSFRPSFGKSIRIKVLKPPMFSNTTVGISEMEIACDATYASADVFTPVSTSVGMSYPET
jgi:hypothetical protein